MDSSMIYILDERIPYAKLKEQLDKSQPMTKVQVVELIISEIHEKPELDFKEFKQKYETMGFKYCQDDKKYEIYRSDLTELEIKHHNKATWNDSSQLKSDLLNTEFSFFIEHEKKILYNRQIEDWSLTAASWLVLSKKREYLIASIDTLLISGNIKPVTKSQFKDEAPIVVAQNYSPEQAIGEIDKDKKENISQKWYALLHLILINLGKKEAISDFSDMKGIMTLGKLHYKLEGTGQKFYREIKNIKGSPISVYVANLSPKDRKKMKELLNNISGGDADVIN